MAFTAGGTASQKSQPNPNKQPVRRVRAIVTHRKERIVQTTISSMTRNIPQAAANRM